MERLPWRVFRIEITGQKYRERQQDDQHRCEDWQDGSMRLIIEDIGDYENRHQRGDQQDTQASFEVTQPAAQGELPGGCRNTILAPVLQSDPLLRLIDPD